MADCENEKLKHEERVRLALQNMPTEEEVEEIATRFKAISEPSRLKILFVLSCGELCVEHITSAVGGNQSAVSHQLKTLKDHRIVKAQRCGKQVMYSIADGHILAMLELAKEHLNCD
ncbi:MAG: ArsR/SmtB family transcription factor [Candidatus Coproplasma sp.]